MARPAITRRQREILDFLHEYVERAGMSPTLDEIANHFGVNRVTIFGHVAELERKGVLRRAARGVSRGLQIVDDPGRPSARAEAGGPDVEESAGAAARAGTSPRPLRVLGTIAAGAPIAEIEDEEIFDLDEMLPDGSDVFVLRVRGESMIEDAICDGDLVLVESRNTARNGEVVVAGLPDGEATLKRYYHEGDRIRLQPANATMEPIYTDSISIRGVVLGVIRRL